MSVEAVIISELLLGILQLFTEKAKAAGMSEQQVRTMIYDVLALIMDTEPENLPDA